MFPTNKVLAAVLLILPLVAAQGVETVPVETGHSLTLALPPLTNAVTSDGGGRIKSRSWRGELLGSEVEFLLQIVPVNDFLISEPESLLWLLKTSVRTPAVAFCSHQSSEPCAEELRDAFTHRGLVARIGDIETWRGDYGGTPLAGYAQGRLTKLATGADQGRLYVLAGIAASRGWILQVLSAPAASPDVEARVLDLFQHGIHHVGALRDERWTDAEAKARFDSYVKSFAYEGDELPVLKQITRTQHYIVLSTIDAGASLLRRLERNHEKVREAFPFTEARERRLMPLILFKSEAEYDRCRPSDVRLGHQGGDTFVTWYRGPEDPILVHEATHEIFENRLFIPGGGKWLQEGVADYVQLSRAHLHTCAEVAARGRRASFASVMNGIGFDDLSQWALDDDRHPWRKTTGPDHLDARMQSALIITFLREDPRFAPSFTRFLAKAGTARANLPAAIDAVSREAFGMGLDELQAAWNTWIDTEAMALTGRTP